MLKENYFFFENNRERIIAGHRGEWAVIRDCAVAGYFKTEDAAFESLVGTGAMPGRVIVQECLSEEDDIYEMAGVQIAPAF